MNHSLTLIGFLEFTYMPGCNDHPTQVKTEMYVHYSELFYEAHEREQNNNIRSCN